MGVFKGNTSSTILNQPQPFVTVIQNFIITNKSAGTVTLNLSIVRPNIPDLSICPLNLQLAPGQSYADRNYEIEINEQIKIEVDGSVDYYFFYQP